MFKSLQQAKQNNQIIILDGGFATECERQGVQIETDLWSSRLLSQDTDMVESVHKSFVQAGANIILTNSYQFAFDEACKELQIDDKEAESLLQSSIELARKSNADHIVASCGSFGAHLCDGSEFTGSFVDQFSLEEIKDFHLRKATVLQSGNPDAFAFETIPSLAEAQQVAEVIQELDLSAWMSFTCKDDKHTGGGDLWTDCVTLASQTNGVGGIGINCTDPRIMADLVKAARSTLDQLNDSDLIIIVYPNRGESWDAPNRRWVEEDGFDNDQFVKHATEWASHGANVIGGCCRVPPEYIQSLSSNFGV